MSGSVGASLCSPRWRPEALIWRILNVIPCDGWVGAAEISTQAGVSSQKVGHLINQHLLYEYVERKPEMTKRKPDLYGRLIRVGGEIDRHHNAVQNRQVRMAPRGEPR